MTMTLTIIHYSSRQHIDDIILFIGCIIDIVYSIIMFKCMYYYY